MQIIIAYLLFGGREMKKLMCLIALGVVCTVVAIAVEELCAHGAPKTKEIVKKEEEAC